jgi:hypothetical protein
MQPRGRLDVDLTGLPDDMEAVMIRETILGQRDRDNLEDALSRGLVPATTDMLPHATSQFILPGDDGPKDKYIRRGSNILMVGKKRDLQGDRAHHRARGEAQIRSAARLADGKSSPIDGENFVETSPEVSDRMERGRPRGPTKFAD